MVDVPVVVGGVALATLAAGLAGLAVARLLGDDATTTGQFVGTFSVFAVGYLGTLGALAYAGVDGTSILATTAAAAGTEVPTAADAVSFAALLGLGAVVAQPAFFLGTTALARPGGGDAASDAGPVPWARAEAHHHLLGGLLLVAVVVVSLGGIFALVVADLLLAIPLLAPVLFAVVASIQSLRANRELPTRPLAAVAPGLVERVAAATGVDPDQLRAVDDVPDVEDLHRPVAMGFGPAQRVFVPLRLVDSTDEDVLEALLRRATASRAFRRYRLAAWALWFGTIPTWLLAETRTADGSLVLVLAGLGILVAPLATVRVGHALVYRSDRTVADQVGTELLVEAMETVASETEDGGRLARLHRALWMVPATDRRLRRLSGDPDGGELDGAES